MLIAKTMRLNQRVLNRPSWVVVVATGLTLFITALSVLLVVVGAQYSGVSVTRQCSIGNQCAETEQVFTKFVPEPVAVVTLLMGAIAALGLVTKKMVLAWTGTVPLLAFSLLTGLSIGLFYLPLAVALVGVLAIMRNQKHTI